MQDDPIAYFITWTCYGTYMPGDERGWTKWHKGDQLPKPLLEEWGGALGFQDSLTAYFS